MSLVTADCAWMKSKSEVTFFMLSGETLSRSPLVGSWKAGLPVADGKQKVIRLQRNHSAGETFF
jgi:hypothetical protein